MRQLALDIRPPRAPTLSEFVAGDNRELLTRLADLAVPKTYDALYLWGDHGSGRSHLLRATLTAAQRSGRPAHYLAAAQVGDDLPLPREGLLLVDDVEQLSPPAEVALFRACNTARLIGLAIAVAGPTPPRDLALREDLRTRIGAMLVFQVKPLSDDEKAAALTREAASRGLKLDAEVLQYLMTRGRRDLSSLMQLLDAMDRLSLELKRRITVPLLRELLTADAGRALPPQP